MTTLDMLKTKTATLALVGFLAAFAPVALQAASPSDAGDRAASEAEVKEAPAATLRQQVLVEDRLIRLGDLFVNAGPNADTAVAYAPEPGKEAVFDAVWLYRVARAYKLGWRPLSKFDQAVVERASTIIEQDEIESLILSALVEKGADPESLLDVSNRDLRMYVASTAQALAEVEDVTYDERTRQFTAVVRAPAGDPQAKRTRVTGRLQKMVEVPVLTRRMLTDEIIRADDIRWVRTRADRLQRDVILDIDEIVGKTPRRGLRADIPVRVSEIRRPVLVKRSGLVTMILQSGSLTLTAKGRALEDGSDGDVIRVSNSQSSLVVEAVVTGSNVVSVRPASHVAMN